MKKNTFALKGQKGVTLIELSVVIAVILVLLSVLFIGAGFYRDSANNAACVINQNGIKKAAESYTNINTSVSASDITLVSDLTGNDLPFATGNEPTCPTNGDYTIAFANNAFTVSCSEGHSE
jgi:prepilin-type N-terminal cleavage/methylation domain-containing protein